MRWRDEGHIIRVSFFKPEESLLKISPVNPDLKANLGFSHFQTERYLPSSNSFDHDDDDSNDKKQRNDTQSTTTTKKQSETKTDDIISCDWYCQYWIYKCVVAVVVDVEVGRRISFPSKTFTSTSSSIIMFEYDYDDDDDYP
jgi:hypothetical protein